MKISVVARIAQMLAAVPILTVAIGGQKSRAPQRKRIVDLTHTLSGDFPFTLLDSPELRD